MTDKETNQGIAKQKRTFSGLAVAGFSAVAAVVAFGTSSLGLYERAMEVFFTPKYSLADKYLIFELDPNIPEEGSPLDVLLEALPEQLPNFMLYRPDWLEEAASTRPEATAILCGEWADHAFEDAFGEPDDRATYIAHCSDRIRLRPFLATYAVSNEDAKTAKGLRIVADRATVADDWIGTLDMFTTFFPDRERSCLFEQIFEDCIVPISDITSVTSEVLPPLRTAETLLFPLYIAWAGSVDMSEFELGVPFDPRPYGGLMRFPMLFPASVTIDGATAIGNVRRMSLTPTLSPGQYEIRG